MSDTENRNRSDKFMLRLPDGMRDQIRDAAQSNGRSMNSEIVTRLERSFASLQIHHRKPNNRGGDIHDCVLVTPSEHRLLHIVEALEQQVEALRAEIKATSEE